MDEMKQVLENIRLSGATLALVDDKLIYTAPPGMAPEEKSAILASLRVHKQEIVDFLASALKDAPSEPVRYGEPYLVAPGIRIRPPRPGKAWLTWRELCDTLAEAKAAKGGK